MSMAELHPSRIARGLWLRRELIGALTLLELKARYRGSLLGVLWTALPPLFMLAVYGFVFGVVFKPRWTADGRVPYVLMLFLGLLLFNVFRDCAVAAPGQMWSRRTYVKKMVFPLEVLPVTLLAGAAVHLGVGLAVFTAAAAAWGVPLTPWAALLPLMLLPLLLTSLAAAWFLASAGVFVRDFAQATQLFVSAAFFLSPVVYPSSAVPGPLRWAFGLNPLAVCIDGARAVLLLGEAPAWGSLAYATALSAAAACAGHAWFMAAKSGFSDVV